MVHCVLDYRLLFIVFAVDHDGSAHDLTGQGALYECCRDLKATGAEFALLLVGFTTNLFTLRPLLFLLIADILRL